MCPTLFSRDSAALADSSCPLCDYPILIRNFNNLTISGLTVDNFIFYCAPVAIWRISVKNRGETFPYAEAKVLCSGLACAQEVLQSVKI